MRTFATTAVAFLAATSFAPQLCAQCNCKPTPSIQVSGTADIYVAPDRARIVLGIDSDDKVLAAAKSANDRISRRVIAVAKKAGIPDTDIQTSAVSVRIVYNDNSARFDHYSATQTIEITLDDIKLADSVLSSAIEAGANRVDQVSFDVHDASKIRAAAREQALKSAKQKAIEMAAVLGQTIGKPSSIVDVSDPYEEDFKFANSINGLHQGGGGGGDGEQQTLATGQVRIRATVNVTFDLQ
jgi:uncharacterized protein YggE